MDHNVQYNPHLCCYHGIVSILVLTARPDIKANRRLSEAAERLGVGLELVDGTRVVAAMETLSYEQRDLLDPKPKVILARVGNWRPESLLALLEVAERAGVVTPNSAPAIRLGRDHWQTIRKLSADGIRVPESLVGADPQELARIAVERLEMPVVVKTRRSRMGIGVMLCRHQDHLECLLESLWRVGEELIVQKFIPCGGQSLRLLIIGGRCVAAARFCSSAGEWRSNAARGGSAVAHNPSEEEKDLALAAARSLGLGMCGVDLFPASNCVVVGEVNPTPGFIKLEEATGIDVASSIVEYASSLITL